MPAELYVHFRLPLPHAKKLRALAELHGVSPSLAARMLVVDSLDDSVREALLHHIAALQEELAAVRAAQREQAEELSRFHAEFSAALRRAVERRA